MEKKEFERKVKKCSRERFIVHLSGGIFINSEIFIWANDYTIFEDAKSQENIVDLDNDGAIIARIPMKLIKEVYFKWKKKN